jgi:hypothetical protein
MRNDRSMSSGGVRVATMVAAELWILGFCKGWILEGKGRIRKRKKKKDP